MIKKTFYSFIFTLLVVSGFSQSLEERLDSLSGIYSFTFQKLNTESFFSEKYLLKIQQPLDYKNISGQTFTQRVFLAHKDFDKPVVFITEGYAADYAANPKYINELSEILDANQVCVEHRYFGESIPDPLNWNDLTVYNAASDHHRVIELLKNIYRGRWISTGISKGGQTAMYHRFYYPDDVDASVGYVCPLNFSVEDKRVYSFLKNVGDSLTRNKILQYQIELLKNKDKYLPEFQKLANERNLTYKIGLEKAFELTVFEYSFSFWQWGTVDSESIPGSKSAPEELIHHLDQVVNIDWVSDEGIQKMRPFFYQALTEIGFYGYDISPFKGLVSYTSNPTFEFTAPEGVDVTYNPVPMDKVDYFVRHVAENMIFIYGEFDPWSSTAVQLTYNTNPIEIVKPGGNHLTRIMNLPADQRSEVITTLEKWLGIGH